MSRNLELKRLYRMLGRILCVLCLGWGGTFLAEAQDALPVRPPVGQAMLAADTLPLVAHRTDTVPVCRVGWPAAFRRVQASVLIDHLGVLHPFWEKLRLMRLGSDSDTVRVVHVGDSHVRGHIFPIRSVRCCGRYSHGFPIVISVSTVLFASPLPATIGSRPLRP